MTRYYAVTGSYSADYYGEKVTMYTNNDLWEQMYVRPKPVIIVCGYCKSHNVIDNATCIRCGAPMGYGFERT